MFDSQYDLFVVVRCFFLSLCCQTLCMMTEHYQLGFISLKDTCYGLSICNYGNFMSCFRFFYKKLSFFQAIFFKKAILFDCSIENT